MLAERTCYHLLSLHPLESKTLTGAVVAASTLSVSEGAQQRALGLHPLGLQKNIVLLGLHPLLICLHRRRPLNPLESKTVSVSWPRGTGFRQQLPSEVTSTVDHPLGSPSLSGYTRCG